MTMDGSTPEEKRLKDIKFRQWGSYVGERQWATVREDYSADGDAWSALTFDDSRSRAYRWGEDGLAGVSDRKQFVNVTMALWNGKDPILKEKLFGPRGTMVKMSKNSITTLTTLLPIPI